MILQHRHGIRRCVRHSSAHRGLVSTGARFVFVTTQVNVLPLVDSRPSDTVAVTTYSPALANDNVPETSPVGRIETTEGGRARRRVGQPVTIGIAGRQQQRDARAFRAHLIRWTQHRRLVDSLDGPGKRFTVGHAPSVTVTVT